MGRQVFLFELDGKQVMGFDTGLDARAFARAKLAQLVTEHGLIVRPGDGEGLPGSVELWKASGVIEYADAGRAVPTMVVWGPVFEGERLDLIVNDSARQDESLSAIALWLRAALTLEDRHQISVPLWPCAAIVAKGREDGESPQVFFAPPSLAMCCLRADGESLYSGYEWYVHPDFGGMELLQSRQEAFVPAHMERNSGREDPAAIHFKRELAKATRRTAFTAAAMLYRVFVGTPPFPATDDILLPQDMRDGNFLPIRLAVPGMDGRLAGIIQRILEPQVKRNAVTGNLIEKPLPGDLLEAMGTASVGSLVLPVSETDRQLLEKEKAQFLKVKTASVKTRRFVIRNAGILLAGIAAIAVAIFFVSTIVNSRAARPTTEGMEPVQVVESYYNAFGELDHHLMENIVLRRVGRNDINMVINLFVINRVRMAHEFSPTPLIISARQWKEMGGGVTGLAVFGVTNLEIEEVEIRRDLTAQRGRARRHDGEELHFRVTYQFWVPAQMLGGPPGARPDTRLVAEGDDPPLPVSFHHVDIVTLVRRQGNWRISDISRVVRS